MPHWCVRFGTTVIAVAALLIFVTSVAAYAQSETYGIDIPSTDVASALRTFAHQAHQQVVFDGELVRGKTSTAVSGNYTALQGLQALLKGTGLTVTAGQKGEFQVSAASSIQPPSTQRDSGAAAAQADVLEEIVVTAQKREERLQDVPVPVTAISAQTLIDNNELRLQDYYATVPGLNLTPADTRGAPILSIRGITTGGVTNPTVGITIDDVPYGSATSLGAGYAAPDIDPSDLARVEVLRGPQGTLYGASSMGGLLKYVTVDPSLDSVSGRVQAGTSSVYNGDQLGYNVRAAVNIPLNNTLAIRLSGFVREDPGYVDDPVLHLEGVNEGHAAGGRIAMLWRPSDDVSLKVSALLQNSSIHGSPEIDVQPGLTGLEQVDAPYTGWYDKQVRAYSAIFKAKLGTFDLTSLTGWSDDSFSDAPDLTPVLGGLSESQFQVSGTPAFERERTQKLTEELRLSTTFADRLDWLLGAFYTHERSHYFETVLAEDALTGQLAGTWIDSDTFPTTYSEYALFTDVTVHVSDHFDVQLGGRASENRQTYSETIIGALGAPNIYGFDSPIIQPELETRDHSFTYLVTPRYKLNEELMAYARFASGYRPGGPNATSTVYGVPSSFRPDTTQNFEIGSKADLFEHRLDFDVSLYYIKWHDLQLVVVDPTTGGGYYANGSEAKSRGIEISVQARPLRGLSTSAWVAWNNAQLTRDFPSGSADYGVSGDRLPDTARFSGNFALDDEFPIFDSVRGSLGGTLMYMGNREGLFTGTATRQNFPAYWQGNLHAGLKYNGWVLNAFIDNVGDARGVLGGGLGTLNPAAFTYIVPRTVGFFLSRTF